MRFSIKNLIKIFFFLFSLSTWSIEPCKITKPLVSLSGPISYILKEFELTKDPNLKAVSSFHHFVKNFSGQRISGGIYLSLKKLQELDAKNYVLFSDESFEIREKLSFFKNKIKNLKRIVFVKSRNKDPFTVTHENLKTLTPYLSKGCGYKVQNLRKDLIAIKKEVDGIKFPGEKTFIFSLGDWQEGSYQTILAKDSFNLVFLENKNFKTYPSDLAYLSPSQKILRKIKKNALFFGLVESNEKKLSVEKIKSNTFNLKQEGILYPGLSQVYFMKHFAKWLHRQTF